MLHAPVASRMRKRPRPLEPSAQRKGEVKFQDVRLYLVERKMGCSRRSFLSQLARSKGFIVEDVLSDKVTHVVSEDNDAAGLWAWLEGCGLKDLPKMQVLDIGWFTDSMREGKPVDTLPRLPEGSTPTPVATVSQYACKRRTTTQNNNKIFTDAFEVLAESYEFNEIEGRCLAFRRAASVLKSLPWAVQRLEATQDLPCLGGHTKAVIQDTEPSKLCSFRRQRSCHSLFTSVFGVGVKTAEKWYRRGLRSFRDILTNSHVVFFPAGFLHYGDISRAVSEAEARALGNIIDEAVRAITPDAVLALTGGFRRGKEFGHDVDYLLTTPELGKEEALLLSVIDRLKHQSILLYCDYQASTLDMDQLPCRRFEAMDHFAKCFLILRLEAGQVEGDLQRVEGDSRSWRAVRVDLVSPPIDHYAFALLGWSGSRQFERDLRRFARLERKMLLDNHALYDLTKKEFLEAKTEKDIFAHLGLEYIEPWQRNA
uniref:DNA-directed DNA/RNA polymerase mu n=1 Tax=Myripristis murdjan TaxID=586833 RepID=A0A667ZPK8_9TELE